MILQQFSHRLRSLQHAVKKLLLTMCLLVLVLVSMVLPPAPVQAAPDAAPPDAPAQAAAAAVQAQAVAPVLPPTFSVQHGFYTSPFQVTLSTATPGAIIRYTT